MVENNEYQSQWYVSTVIAVDAVAVDACCTLALMSNAGWKGSPGE
jgi:hypothetical protein